MMHEKPDDRLDEKCPVISGRFQVDEPGDPDVTPRRPLRGLRITKITKAPAKLPNPDPHRVHVGDEGAGDGHDGEVVGIRVVEAVEGCPDRLSPHARAARRARQCLASISTSGSRRDFGRRPPCGTCEGSHVASLDAVGQDVPVPSPGSSKFLDEVLNDEVAGADLGTGRSMMLGREGRWAGHNGSNVLASEFLRRGRYCRRAVSPSPPYDPSQRKMRRRRVRSKCPARIGQRRAV